MRLIEVNDHFTVLRPLSRGCGTAMAVPQAGVHPQGEPGRRLDPVYPADSALPGLRGSLESNHQAIGFCVELYHVIRLSSRTVETTTLSDRVAVQSFVTTQNTAL